MPPKLDDATALCMLYNYRLNIFNLTKQVSKMQTAVERAFVSFINGIGRSDNIRVILNQLNESMLNVDPNGDCPMNIMLQRRCLSSAHFRVLLEYGADVQLIEWHIFVTFIEPSTASHRSRVVALLHEVADYLPSRQELESSGIRNQSFMEALPSSKTYLNYYGSLVGFVMSWWSFINKSCSNILDYNGLDILLSNDLLTFHFRKDLFFFALKANTPYSQLIRILTSGLDATSQGFIITPSLLLQ